MDKGYFYDTLNHSKLKFILIHQWKRLFLIAFLPFEEEPSKDA